MVFMPQKGKLTMVLGRNISSMKSDVQSLVGAMSKLNTMSFGPSHKQVKRVGASRSLYSIYVC